MFSSSRLVLGNLAQQFCRQAPQRLQQSLVPCISTALFHVSAADYMPSRHGGFNRKDYNVLRERPVGPHKRLAPGEKYDGRVGPHLNYRYIIHYPKVSTNAMHSFTTYLPKLASRTESTRSISSESRN